MDKALKARLIGAAVLVALAVLLIPELLSGRKAGESSDEAAAASPGARTFTIELAGGGPDQAPPAATVPEPTSSTSPVPAAAATGSPSVAPDIATETGPVARTDQKPTGQAIARDAGDAAPGAGTGVREDKAPAQATTAGAAPRAGGEPAGWAVQVGAFSSVETANKLAAELKLAGYKAYLSPVSKAGKTLQRVRVGPEADRSRAEGVAARLKARGLPATVVASE